MKVPVSENLANLQLRGDWKLEYPLNYILQSALENLYPSNACPETEIEVLEEYVFRLREYVLDLRERLEMNKLSYERLQTMQYEDVQWLLKGV